MQRYMKATFILAVDSHSTIEFAILSSFTNMEINHSNLVGHP